MKYYKDLFGYKCDSWVKNNFGCLKYFLIVSFLLHFVIHEKVFPINKKKKKTHSLFFMPFVFL